MTKSRDFLPSQLITSISIRLQACSIELLSKILPDFPRDHRGTAFKLSICDRYLARAIRVNMDADLRGAARPQARRARPIQTDRRPASPSKHQVRSTNSLYSWILPNSQRALQVLESRPNLRASSSNASMTRLVALDHFLSAFGSAKIHERTRGSEIDQLWHSALHEERFTRNVTEIFTNHGLPEQQQNALNSMRDSLIGQCTVWKRLYTWSSTMSSK